MKGWEHMVYMGEDRSKQLGPYGVYTDEKVKEVGLKAAIKATADHLEFLIGTPMVQKKRETLTMELNRLRSQHRSL